MKLTRPAFLAALFGIPVAAQQPVAMSPQMHIPVGAWSVDGPKNGQCPVCGEMAPRFTLRQAEVASANELGWVFSRYVTANGHKQETATRLTRCARCSVAFYQDAEEK